MFRTPHVKDLALRAAAVAGALALAVPATAAAQTLVAQQRDGASTSSRHLAGSCSAAASKYYAGDLYLSCRRGNAVARYAFTLPAKVKGTVSYAASLSSSAGHVTAKLARLDARHVSVTVTVGAGGHVDIRGVSISYYVS